MKKFMQIEMSMLRTGVALAVALLCGQSVRSERIELSAAFGCYGIELPDFPRREFRIDDYGARTGELCTTAINAAMRECSLSGGGRVVVPRGAWITGAVHLRSGCMLWLDEGAVLEFTDNPADYPVVQTAWEGVECLNHSPLVYAFGATNVAVCGKGTLVSKMDRWRVWFERTPQHLAATEMLYHWGATNAPLSVRNVAMLPDANVRPHLMQFNRCSRVLLDGFKIRESPFWTIHLFHSEDCILRNLDSRAHGFNSDGVDVEMTKNVLVENCRFDQGDDGIVLKAGRNQDAWRLARPTENVIVRNCEFVSADTLMAVGSELSGGIRNVHLHDCRISRAHNLLHIKTNRRRGGFVENVTVENVAVSNVNTAVFALRTDVLYQWARFPDYELRRTAISNISLNNIYARCADYAFEITGDIELPPKGLHFRNVRVDSVRKEFSKIVNVHDVTCRDVSLGSMTPIPWRRK